MICDSSIRKLLVSYMPLARLPIKCQKRSGSGSKPGAERLIVINRKPVSVRRLRRSAAISQPSPPCEQHKTRVLSKHQNGMDFPQQRQK